MSYDNQQHPADPISVHNSDPQVLVGYRKNAYSTNSEDPLPDQGYLKDVRPPPPAGSSPIHGTTHPSPAGAPDPLDQGHWKDSPLPITQCPDVQGHVEGVCPSLGNTIQVQTSIAGNLQHGKPSLVAVSSFNRGCDLKDSPQPQHPPMPAYTQGHGENACPDQFGNSIQNQTPSTNLQQGKPSPTDSSWDKVVKQLENNVPGPIGAPIPSFPPANLADSDPPTVTSSTNQEKTSWIKKCLAALSPCFG